MGRGVWDWRPAGDLGDGLPGKDEDLGLTGGLVPGDQHRFGLAVQGSDGDLLHPPVSGSPDGGIQAAQIHVGGDHEGHPGKEGVPDGNVRGWRLIRLIQCGPDQPVTVVGLGHDLKLYRPGGVTGEEMDGKLETLICTPIGDQLGVSLSVGLQLGEDIFVACASKDESPLCAGKSGSLVGKGSQLIRQCQLADAGADIVDSAEQVPQVGDCRHAGAAPGVGALFSCQRR